MIMDTMPLYWIIGVIVFLCAYAGLTVVVVRKKIKTATPRQLVSLYMLLKGIKLLAFFALIAVYLLAIKIESKRVVLISVAAYFISLLFDTLYLASVEKNLKKNDKK